MLRPQHVIFPSGVPFEDRVDQILEWLSLPSEEIPDLIIVYFEEPDSAGHDEGPYGDLVSVFYYRDSRLCLYGMDTYKRGLLM